MRRLCVVACEGRNRPVKGMPHRAAFGGTFFDGKVKP